MKIKKILYYIAIGLISVLVIFITFSLLPIKGNYKILVVGSGSMEPTIKTGGIVAIKPMVDYKAGDIITFKTSSAIAPSITHRILEVKVKDGIVSYTTKGDANGAQDIMETAKSAVVGKVFLSVPYVGYVVNFIKRPLGFLLIILIPAIFIIYSELAKAFKEYKNIRNKPKASKEDN